VLVGAGLLNSPSKARVQDLQIDTGILSWGDPTDSQRNIGKLCFLVLLEQIDYGKISLI
jgi:hypothetical protein